MCVPSILLNKLKLQLNTVMIIPIKYVSVKKNIYIYIAQADLHTCMMYQCTKIRDIFRIKLTARCKWF